MRVSCNEDGLHVVCNGEEHVSGLQLEGGLGAGVGWQFGFGARTRTSSMKHAVDQVSILMDALVHDTAVEVQVSMDGQHFNSALPSTGGMMYTYQAAPVVSSLSPSSGPTKGSTTVIIPPPINIHNYNNQNEKHRTK